MDQATPGTLHVVATPIGNRDDISARAVQVLRSVALIAAEDTRHSRPLLAHLGVDTPLKALHEHNEDAIAQALVERLLQGEDVALISDAGTPLVSDPGYRLVRAARAAGVRVSPVPGACAAIAALSAAGLPSDRFVFEGFLPAKRGARRSRLEALAAETRTLIFYESPHRVAETLDDMRAAFGDEREAVLARELTKLFETVLGEPLAALAARVAADSDQQRGECVLLVAGCADAAEAQLAEGRRLFALLREELPPSKAARLASSISGAPRKALYGD
ncbi:16S rRNA (cytidine(1402)-2'-O)-methyltransferase [Oleiagrimonas soli]|uniref:Ribosomal RNA small subunit methyltransferase I n=1 Tax=Oleiagrimonas soli TaxID=1543381 RepID=A0A099CVM9_9GAMM|nr:16S rRNA (cytidine(1402)-2'-O)-methyltransferase [Oleiagrimonas soli]KGI77065.1 tetrapyrrole methylase [Oleiagrimonas soli]MBB6185403.1 16S rRNA (cytidine1402-2'-O)-methyltransferase [Oleiagrimonas soli]